MKKKIAIVVPGGIGGGNFKRGIPVLEDYVQRISVDHDVVVYSLVNVSDKGAFQYEIRSIRSDHKTFIVIRYIRLGILLLKDHFFKQKFQLIHGIWGYPSGVFVVFLSKLLRIPSVISVRGGECTCVPQISYGHMCKPVLRRFILWACRNADALVGLTRFQIDQFKRFGLSRKDVHIIPNGVDTQMFTGTAKKVSPPYHILHVANLNEVKDQVTLLKAFKRINEKVECTLKIVGADYLNGKLQQITTDLGLNDKVEFVGAVPHDQLASYFHWAHILLHTSLYEGQGVTISEAAASKVLICGTNVGLISDLGDEMVGMVDVGQHEFLADVAIKHLEDQDLFRDKVQMAYDWVIKHDIDWNVNQFIQLYGQLTNKK